MTELRSHLGGAYTDLGLGLTTGARRKSTSTTSRLSGSSADDRSGPFQPSENWRASPNTRGPMAEPETIAILSRLAMAPRCVRPKYFAQTTPWQVASAAEQMPFTIPAATMMAAEMAGKMAGQMFPCKVALKAPGEASSMQNKI